MAEPSQAPTSFPSEPKFIGVFPAISKSVIAFGAENVTLFKVSFQTKLEPSRSAVKLEAEGESTLLALPIKELVTVLTDAGLL